VKTFGTFSNVSLLDCSLFSACFLRARGGVVVCCEVPSATVFLYPLFDSRIQKKILRKNGFFLADEKRRVKLPARVDFGKVKE